MGQVCLETFRGVLLCIIHVAPLTPSDAGFIAEEQTYKNARLARASLEAIHAVLIREWGQQSTACAKMWVIY